MNPETKKPGPRGELMEGSPSWSDDTKGVPVDRSNVAVSRIEMTPVSGREPSFTAVGSFLCTYHDGRGRQIGAPQYREVEIKRSPDVLDLVLVREGASGPEILTTTVQRPAILFQDNDSPVTGDATFTELPGAYIRVDAGHFSFEETARFITETQLGIATDVSSMIPLGGSYRPSVGGSTENCFMELLRLPEGVPSSWAVSGEGMRSHLQVGFLTPQGIVDGYFNGDVRDLRLVLAAFRVADRYGIKLDVPFSLVDVPAVSEGESVVPILSTEDIAAISQGVVSHDGISGVTIAECTRSERPFLRQAYLDVVHRNSSDEIVGAYPLELVVRPSKDSVDVAAYGSVDCGEGPEVVMLLKEGVRESLVVANRFRRPVYCDVHGLMVEGIAESLEGESSIEEICQRAVSGVEEEGGVQVLRSLYLGASFPSPGASPELAHAVLAACDLAKPVSARADFGEIVRRGAARPRDIIALGDQGIIRDPRLLLGAYFLRSAVGYNPKVHGVAVDDPTVVRMSRLLHEGSRVQRWLSESAREIDAALSSYPPYQILKEALEDEFGMEIVSAVLPEEGLIFDGNLPYLLASHQSDPRKNPFVLLHDMRHWVIGGMLPFVRSTSGDLVTDSSGSLVPIPFEEFRRGNTGNECEAVYFSDVECPKHFGYERSREIFRGTAVGEALEAMGFEGARAREVVFLVEQEGVIPVEILEHARYAEYKDVIEGRLLRFHVLDTHHLRKMYDAWIANPEVAKVFAEFFPLATHDAEEHERRFLGSMDELERRPRGSNPFRAAFSRTIFSDIGVEAARLTFYKQQVRATDRPGANALVEAIDSMIDRLSGARSELLTLRRGIRDTEMSPDNRERCERLFEIQDTTIREAKLLSASVKDDPRFLTESQREYNRDRLLPFFAPLPFEVSPDLRERMEHCVQESARRRVSIYSYASPVESHRAERLSGDLIPEKQVRHYSLPSLGIGTSGIGSGSGSASLRGDESLDAREISGLRRALDLGFRHFDTAMVYAQGTTEALLGFALNESGVRDARVTTKVLPEHLGQEDLVRVVQESARRLEYPIDTLLLHSPNHEIPIEETVRGLVRVIDDGLVRHLGVSNHALESVEKLRRALPSDPRYAIKVCQAHYSLRFREPVTSGLLEYCREQGILFCAWRPLEKGGLTGEVPPIMRELCGKYDCTPAQLALAWVVSQENVVALVRSSSEAHLRENRAALDIKMSRGDHDRLTREYPEPIARDPRYPLS